LAYSTGWIDAEGWLNSHLQMQYRPAGNLTRRLSDTYPLILI
jgi:hypothetical protein